MDIVLPYQSPLVILVGNKFRNCEMNRLQAFDNDVVILFFSECNWLFMNGVTAKRVYQLS